MMTALLFIAVLWVLIFVHELGHFLLAKRTGCRVDEFAIGFRPALLQKKIGETNYILGLIPLGGYVKIWGENGSAEVEEDPHNPRAFYNRPRLAQALVLFGGILFNVVFAWMMFVGMFMIGTTVVASQYPSEVLSDTHVEVFSVLPGSSADSVGIGAGDVVVSLAVGEDKSGNTADDMRAFIESHSDESFTIEYRDTEGIVQTGIATTQTFEDRQVIGFDIDTVGTVRLGLGHALIEGVTYTWQFIVYIVTSMKDLVINLFSTGEGMEQIAGPIGIAPFVQTALDNGYADFIYFVGQISLSLAVFNLLPIPALDGGRLVFVAVESIIRRPINPRLFLWVNGIGFLLLIGLMIFVTYNDITRLIL